MRKLPNVRSLLTRKTALAVAGGVAVVAVSGTAAFAFWSTTGTGSGSAATGTNTAVTIVQTSTVSGLAPGGTAQAVDFKINNPASTNQYVASVSMSIASIANAQVDGGKPACIAGDFTLVQPNAINADLAPGDTAFSPSGATFA